MLWNYYNFLSSHWLAIWRNAFRHITWNVLMRRYVGNTIAYLNAGANEVCDSNKCSSKQMDFHNNYVGRVSKYSVFRDKPNTKKWQWKKWCENVRTFVNDSNNAVYVGNGRWWDNLNELETKTCKQIRKDRNTISDYNTSIYINKSMKKLLVLTSLLILSACEMSPVYDYYFSIRNYSAQTVFAEFEFDNKSFSDTLRPYNGNSPRVLSGGVNLYEDLDLQTVNSLYTCTITIIDSNKIIEISNLDDYTHYTSEDNLTNGRKIISKKFGYNIW